MSELRAQLIRYAPRSRMPPHTDGCRRLSVLVTGELLEGDRGRSERAAVGSVALKAPGFVHENRFGNGGATIVSAILPDRLVARLGHAADALTPWRWHHDGRPSLAGLRLAASLCGGDGAGTEESLIELLGEFLAFRDAPSPPPRLQRVRDRVRDASTPTGETAGPSPHVRRLVSRMAADEGLHPVSLGRSFRRQFGCSITRYRQRLRVEAATRALIKDDDELVDVALDQGFSDLSHLTRVFRRELGLPPGRFRTMLRGALDGLESFKTEWAVRL